MESFVDWHENRKNPPKRAWQCPAGCVGGPAAGRLEKRRYLSLAVMRLLVGEIRPLVYLGRIAG